jgi:hypothetical protein
MDVADEDVAHRHDEAVKRSLYARDCLRIAIHSP